jgi:hypothetical protein
VEPRGFEPLTFCLPVIYGQWPMRADLRVFCFQWSHRVRFGRYRCWKRLLESCPEKRTQPDGLGTLRAP